MKSLLPLTIGLSLAGALTAPSHAAGGLSEQDYFEALPVVLTVSRLEQPISDTPGAVTVLDRETIRRSGARDVTDLLRLVPGYLVSGWNGANPNAMYHAPLDDYGTRNLVMIDGRSVYSPFYLGDTHRGMMTVLLEDIERIEVLRGSNSAAYGANAMFGVINIVTRHSSDTLGGELSVSTGSSAVQDVQARVGWGEPNVATYRLSAGARKDTGFIDLFDDRDLRQVHFRGDWRLGLEQDILFETGATELRAGEGRQGVLDNPERNTQWRDWYLRGQWKRQLSDDEEIKLSLDFDEEHNTDVAPYGPTDVLLDYSGRGRRYNIELQHQFSLTEGLRFVWGLGYKQDEALSPALYNSTTAVKVHENRAFGNLEWRLTPWWLINAGWFIGQHSKTGTYNAPRLMSNFQLAPDHTIRLGVTRSVRSPTLFEMAGNVRYYSEGQLVGNTVLATGGVQPETLGSSEIGYFGHFRDWRMTLDVRAYHERLKDMTWVYPYPRPYGAPVWWAPYENGQPVVYDYINLPGVVSRGVEFQWRWSPAEGSDLWLSQNWQDYKWQGVTFPQRVPPRHATTVAWFQQLPANMQLSLTWHALGKMPWRSSYQLYPSTRRLDMRLAKAFKLGGTRAETALTVQSLNGAQTELLTNTGAGVRQSARRSYLTLRLEY